METILNTYYENNAQKLHKMVDNILFKLRLDVDSEDFYSLANEIFVDAIRRYDKSQSFDTFLYSCLSNKIKTEMTRRNRYKRQADREAVSIYTPLKDDEDLMLKDVIADEFNIEDEIFEKREDGYSNNTLAYLSRLSNLQKEVLWLTVDGYLPKEIKEQLHITDKQYSDCNKAIHSYRNISILM